VFAGRWAGTWRHRQRAREQDAFVALWKEAWVQGCQAAWADRPSLVPPEMTDPLRSAWTAGWTWAQTQPDRRRGSLGAWKLRGRRSSDVQRPLARAVKGGAAGLVVFAAARWLMGARRGADASGPASAP
jgi:hypothetical protein